VNHVTKNASLPLVAGNDLVLTCTADVGKPPGELTWIRTRKHDAKVALTTDYDDVTQLIHLNDNGTTRVVSEVRVKLTELEDQAVYRCEASAQDGRISTVTRWAEYHLQVNCM
jgi:Immunoglobulin domain